MSDSPSPTDGQDPEKALSHVGTQQNSINDSSLSAKENDFGEADKDIEAGQDEEQVEEEDALEPLPTDETNRDAALGGGIEGRPVHKVLTKIKSKPDSVNNVSSIPNGGLRAWLQVAGAFVLFLNTWGIMNTFGVYQTYYETRSPPLASPSSISWIGSVQAFLLMLVGAITGPIYDAGYFRELLLSGSFFVVLGHMMLSLCTKYWEVILAQAFCIGIGTGLLFVPSVAILSTYFNTKLAFAVGLAASGSSLGGVVYPIALYKMIPEIGFPWAVRTLGFIMLLTLLIPNTVMRVRVLPTTKRPLIDTSAFTQPSYMLFALGGLIGFLGLYTPFFYGQYYAIQTHVTNENLAFYLLSILNSASVFGRIIPNFMADYVGPMNMIVPCVLISGVLILCLVAIKSVGPIVAFNLLYGFFSGAFVSLPPTIIVHLSPNRGLIGTRMGMCFMIISIGILIGTPISGQILAKDGWSAVWIFAGVFTLAGGTVMCASRVAYKGWSLRIKA